MDESARHLRLLTETIAAVNSSLDLEEVLVLIARRADALEADACFVYLYDEHADEPGPARDARDERRRDDADAAHAARRGHHRVGRSRARR